MCGVYIRVHSIQTRASPDTALGGWPDNVHSLSHCQGSGHRERKSELLMCGRMFGSTASNDGLTALRCRVYSIRVIIVNRPGSEEYLCVWVVVTHAHRGDPCVGGGSGSVSPPIAVHLVCHLLPLYCVWSMCKCIPPTATTVPACAHCICLFQQSIDPRWNECRKVQRVCGAVLWLCFQCTAQMVCRCTPPRMLDVLCVTPSWWYHAAKSSCFHHGANKKR